MVKKKAQVKVKKKPTKVKKPKKDLLSINEELFCLEMADPLNYNNKTNCYIKAFPKRAHWKRKTINEHACKLSKQDKILTRILEIKKEICDERIASAEEVLVGLTMETRFDPRNLYDEFGNLKSVKDLDTVTALGLKGFEHFETVTESKKGNVTTTSRSKFIYPDKTRAREILGKHHGIYEKDNAQKPGLTVALTEKDRDELVKPKTDERVNDILNIHRILVKMENAEKNGSSS